MSYYKKVISYIDLYEYGSRMKNIGYIKSEVRDHVWKLRVCLKGLPSTDTLMCEIKTVGTEISMGHFQIEKGQGSFEKEYNAYEYYYGTKGLQFLLSAKRYGICNWECEERDIITSSHSNYAVKAAECEASARKDRNVEFGELSENEKGMEQRKIQKMQEIPVMQTISENPRMPQHQEMPGMSGKQNMQESHGMSNMHRMSNMQNRPCMRGKPNMQRRQETQEVPKIQRMPETQRMQNQNCMSEMQDLPEMQEMSEIQRRSGGQEFSEMQRMPDQQNMPEMYDSRGMSGMQNMSKQQHIREINKISNMQNIQKMPLTHGNPEIQELPEIQEMQELQYSMQENTPEDMPIIGMPEGEALPKQKRQEYQQNQESPMRENPVKEENRKIMEENGQETMRQDITADKWQQLCSMFAAVKPFKDDSQGEFLSVKPKDFIVLSEQYQSLASNSFLLHGFYNYSHLILGRKNMDGSTKYYIGVPGIYHEREKKVAIMFNFEAFEGTDGEEMGAFGYYMKAVTL